MQTAATLPAFQQASSTPGGHIRRGPHFKELTGRCLEVGTDFERKHLPRRYSTLSHKKGWRKWIFQQEHLRAHDSLRCTGFSTVLGKKSPSVCSGKWPETQLHPAIAWGIPGGACHSSKAGSLSSLTENNFRVHQCEAEFWVRIKDSIF